MNTTKKIGIALAVLMVVALAAPVSATYAGDKPLVTYAKGQLKDGGIVYETVTDGSAYKILPCNIYPEDPEYGLTQEITIRSCVDALDTNCIPDGATVKMARLYNYVTWSTCDNDTKYTSGVPAEAVLTFNGVPKSCVHGFSDEQIDLVPNPIDYGNGVIQYWDTKGWYPGCLYKYDYPSGTFAWDVTNMVNGSGTYTAKIVNADSTPTGMRPEYYPDKYHPYYYRERFATYGFGLLVVYENTSDSNPVDGRYWIDEGCDLLYNTSLYGVSEPVATTYAPFKEGVGMSNNPYMAGLTTVVTASNMWNKTDWDKSENMIYFNGLTPAERIGPSTAGATYYTGSKHIGVNYDDVINLLQPSRNVVYFQDIDIPGLPYPAKDGKGDNEVVSNAFLLVKWNTP